MLVNATEMLIKARDGHYGVPQLNINNLEWTKSVLTACTSAATAASAGIVSEEDRPRRPFRPCLLYTSLRHPKNAPEVLLPQEEQEQQEMAQLKAMINGLSEMCIRDRCWKVKRRCASIESKPQ